MFIIQHRVNDHKQEQKARFAEVDVWVCDDGKLRLKHDVKGDAGCAPPIDVETFLASAPWEKYFVNVKQSLSIQDYLTIEGLFNSQKKLIGMFDVPMPNAKNLNDYSPFVYERISEFEGGLDTGAMWVDPLTGNSPKQYFDLFEKIRSMRGTTRIMPGDNVIVCCPSLHGYTMEYSNIIWEWIKGQGNWLEVAGIVTKYPKEAAEVLGD